MDPGCSVWRHDPPQPSPDYDDPRDGFPFAVLRATFVNVGQGDCTLVRGGGRAVLFDGGRRGRMTKAIGQMRALTNRLSLVVGTHYDGDHLAGLQRVVETYGACIDLALVPPVVHPLDAYGRVPGARELGWDVRREKWFLTGERGAVRDAEGFLAEHLGSGPGALRRVLRQLDDAAREPAAHAHLLGRVAGDLGGLPGRELEDLVDRAVHEQRRSDRSGVERVETAEGSRPGRDADPIEPSAPTAAEIAGDVARRHLLRDLGRRLDPHEHPHLTRVLAVAMRVANSRDRRREPGESALAWAAALTAFSDEQRAVAGAVQRVVNDAVTARWLSSLIEALNRQHVPWDVAVAPDTARWLGGPVSLAQLAPLRRSVAAHHTLLPRGVPAYSLEAVPVTRLPTVANRLSSVFAVREDSYSAGLLISGDSGFEALSAGAEPVIGHCALLDVAHHGGTWGEFPRVIEDAHARTTGPLTLYTSNAVKPRGSGPPSPNVRVLRHRLDAAGRGVDSFFANGTARENVGCLGCLDRRPGPRRLDFVLYGGRWHPRTAGAVRCRC